MKSATACRAASRTCSRQLIFFLRSFLQLVNLKDNSQTINTQSWHQAALKFKVFKWVRENTCSQWDSNQSLSESYTNLLPFEPLVLIITIHGGNRKRFWLYDSNTDNFGQSFGFRVWTVVRRSRSRLSQIWFWHRLSGGCCCCCCLWKPIVNFSSSPSSSSHFLHVLWEKWKIKTSRLRRQRRRRHRRRRCRQGGIKREAEERGREGEWEGEEKNKWFSKNFLSAD